MKFLLDTNICIYIINKKPRNVLNKFELLHPGDIFISSITLAELQFGIEKSIHKERNRKALEEFTIPLEIASFDEAAARHYGILRHYLEAKGKLIGSLDLMIASQALSLNFPLVTNNISEFSRVPELVIEDWTKI